MGNFIQTIRTDNGGEFLSAGFKSFLWERGIQHAMSPPYTPQFQGKVERMNRTVGNKAHAMRVGAGLTDVYWELAWECAVFLRNRSPTSANADKLTPYESMFGRKPMLHNLRVFGCRAEALVPDALRTKGSDRTRSGIFVGYDEVSRGYRFLPDGSKKWVSVRTLAFKEDGGSVSTVKSGWTGPSLGAADKGLPSTMGQLEDAPQLHDLDGGVNAMDEEAEEKKEERPKMAAAKSLPMVTRAQLKKGLQGRYGSEEHLAMLVVGEFGVGNLELKGMEVRIPKSVKEALSGPERVHWEEAMRDEVKSMEEAEVWGPPLRVGEQTAVTPLRFIFAKKLGADGEVERFKARLIFQNKE
jgi:hypothetical protein